MTDVDLKSFAPDTEDRAALRQSFFGSVVGQAAVLVGLLIFYFGGLAILVSFAGEPLKELRRWFEDDFGRAWGLGLFYLILAAPFLAVIAFSALPLALRARSEARLERLDFKTVPTPPVSEFRLAPYSAIDRERYRRLDGLQTRALDWLRTAPDTVLHLSGESGVGKSSLLAAFLVPALTDEGWAVHETRAFGDGADRLARELRDRRDLFPHGAGDATTAHDLLVRFGNQRRKDKPPLLVILDQFEEVLILTDTDADGRDPMLELIEKLAAEPIEGVRLLLVYRSDYRSEIFKHDLPAPVPNRTSFELGRYNRREAEAFLEAGGRLPAPASANLLFAGLDRIEGTPGLYRQITLNMVGLFMERMGERLSTDPGQLIQDYLRQSLQEGDADAVAARQQVLDQLVTEAGTKRPLTEAQLCQATGLPLHRVRDTLHGLAGKGLARALEGGERVWEIAHDFLAALIGRLIGRVRPSRWSMIRPALGPAAVLGWVAVLAIGLPWWEQRAEAVARRLIHGAEGSIHAMPDGRGYEIRFDIKRLSYCDRPVPDWSAVFSGLSSLDDVRTVRFDEDNAVRFDEDNTKFSMFPKLTHFKRPPFACRAPALGRDLALIPSDLPLELLDLTDTRIEDLEGMPDLPALTGLVLSRTPIASLEGMPELPGLTTLDLSGTQITTLEGMPELPALTHLSLRDTPINSLEGMPDLPALTALYLWGTQIASLEGMPDLHALMELDLSGTPITSLQGMPDLHALTELNLWGTPIADLSPLRGRDPMPEVLIDDRSLPRSLQ